MADCCESKAEDLGHFADSGRRRVLWIVLGINLAMFFGELLAGWLAQSQALIADSADNLGDVLVYAMSLAVVARSLRWRAGAALVKGVIQAGFAFAVIASIVASLLGEPQPVGAVMMIVAAVALVGNLTCFTLLMKHRNEDVNMRSVWLCSRNDVIGNAAVIVSGALVMLLGTFWPDILVASAVALIFLHTAFEVLRDALRDWKRQT